MSPKLFIEVDAGKEQPEIDAIFENVNWSIDVPCMHQDGRFETCFFNFDKGCWINTRDEEIPPPAFWLRPIQQQEGLAIEFAEWTQKKHYHSWTDVIQGSRLWSNYSPGDERHDKNLTTSELFNQFINSIK